MPYVPFRGARMRHVMILLALGASVSCAPAVTAPVTPTSAHVLAESRETVSPGAERWVRSAMAAMGGEEELRALRMVRLEGMRHLHAVEQSERPEPPWTTLYEQFDEYDDFDGTRVHRTMETSSYMHVGARKTAMVLASGVVAKGAPEKMGAGDAVHKDELEARLALGPERILQNALAAGDLRDGRDAMLQGVWHHVVHFTWRSTPVSVYLNEESHLPTAVETLAQHRDFAWGVWGDVRTRILFCAWDLLPGGLRYPRQLDLERNGLLYESTAIMNVTLNPAAAPQLFAVPEAAAKAYPAAGWHVLDEHPTPLAKRPAETLHEGIIKIAGTWDVALVQQPDGLVIVEAPISSQFSAEVLVEAKRRFPGVPVKAVISTSDAWPHVGGLREYVAEGIPIYLLDRNKPLVERLLAAPHRIAPDKLARSPREPKFRVVSRMDALGEGPNRMAIYPMHTENGERMLMIHFPEHRLLYAADSVQIMPNGEYFFPGYLADTAEAVAREKLAVDRVFAMHAQVTPWSTLLNALQKAKGGS